MDTSCEHHSKPRNGCKTCPRPGRGYKWCRCGQHIPRDMPECWKCVEFGREYHQTGDTRRASLHHMRFEDQEHMDFVRTIREWQPINPYRR